MNYSGSAVIADGVTISDDGRQAFEAGVGSPGGPGTVVYDWQLPISLPWSW